MSSNLFLIIALVTSGIFVAQFVFSFFAGDIDTDIDADFGSIISFKGLTHFGIGFGWYMYLREDTGVLTYLTGIFVGVSFVIAMWFLYKRASRLQQTTSAETTDQLAGRECTIYFSRGDGRYTVQVERDGAMREADVVSASGKQYRTGDKVLITNYENGQLYIQ